MRKWFKNQPIRAKLAVILLVSNSFGLLTLFGAMMGYQVFGFRAELQDRFEVTAQVVGINSTAALVFADARAAREVLNALSADRNVLCAHTLTSESQPLAQYGQCPDFKPQARTAEAAAGSGVSLLAPHHDVLIPVELDGSVVGAVHVRFSLEQWFTVLRRYVLILSLTLLAAGALAWKLSSIFQRAISRPLGKLIDMMGRVSGERDYSLRARPKSQDEVGTLMQGFNEMLAEIQQRDEKLIRQNDELEDKVTQRTVELSNALRAAEAGTRAKSEFMATMSHEIRTPLNGVIGMADLLSATHLSAQQHEFVDTLRRSSDLLMAIISDILDFSKIDAGQLKLELRAINLPELAQSTAALIAPLAAAKGLSLECHVMGGVPQYVLADETRISQILGNLLSNAIKFTAQGRVTLMVDSNPPGVPDPSGAQGLHTVRLAVRDTGIGMTPEQQARLFQPFSQADASTTRKFGGTGLGLAICKKLVQAMGGDISLTSAPGQGSTFSVSLPLRAAEASENSGIIFKRATGLEGRHMLLVDDSPDDLKLLGKLATTLGLHIVTATTGQEALAMIDRGEPVEGFDVVLLDLRLPDMDGQQLARAIRQRPRYAKLPMVLITASTNSLNAHQLMKDFSDILFKPARLQTLANALTQCLRPASPSAPSAQSAQSALGRSGLTLESRLDPAHFRTLVADDNDINRKVITLTLKGLGLDARTAETGREALLAVQANPYNLILMDMQMPEMDGLDATREIRRSLPPERQPYIIALTANAMAGDRERCIEAGMDDYLTKPIRTPLLLQALEKARDRLGGGGEGNIVPRTGEYRGGGSARPAAFSPTSPVGPAAEPMPSAPAAVPCTSAGDYVPAAPAAATSGEAGDVIDWSLAEPLKQSGLMDELLPLFFNRLPGQLAAIRQSRDAQTALDILHKLKGSSATFGMAQVAATCATLERQVAGHGVEALNLLTLEEAARIAGAALGHVSTPAPAIGSPAKPSA